MFSPDGKKIAFASDRTGNYEIWICNNNGKNPKKLTSFNGSVPGSPNWSPDEQQIAFDCFEDEAIYIYTLDVKGGDPQRITKGMSDDAIPRWSVDGKWIYFRSDRSGVRQIWKIPKNGGEAIQVTQNGGFAAFESPDGQWLYFSKPDTTGIWKIPVEGGAEILVTAHSVHQRNWILKGEDIYYLSDTDSSFNVECFNLSTGNSEKITERMEEHDLYLDVSPDRRWILYTQQDQGESDIMLMENFR
jgi:Tol biopolymer transport system component